jgi:hypothetical protein
VLLTAFNGVLGLLPLVFKMNVDLVHRSVTVGGPSADRGSSSASPSPGA